MKATIVHESRGRLRLRLHHRALTLRQADLLETWLKGQSWVCEAAVHERTGCVILTYQGERAQVLSAIGGGRAGGHIAGAQYARTQPQFSGKAGGQSAW